MSTLGRYNGDNCWTTLAGAFAAGLVMLAFAASAQAATFTVNSTGDDGDASLNGICATATSVCTLRAAIQESDSSTAVADTISFALPNPSTINLTGALPNIVDTLTISGPGADALTVRRDSGGAYRIFTIPFDGDVTISGLTLSDGLSDDTTTPGSSGGAIAAVASPPGSGTLSLSDVTISDNTATSATAWAYGGGIYREGGNLSISNSTIENNTASFTAVTTAELRFSAGGGIAKIQGAGDVSIVDSTIRENTASSTATSPTSGAASGGAYLESADITLTNDTFSNNHATSPVNPRVGGAGLDSSDAGSTAVLTEVTLDGNDAIASGTSGTENISASYGGLAMSGIKNVTWTGGAVSDNSARATSSSTGKASAIVGGAGINAAETVTVTDVAISGNDATADAQATGSAGASFGGLAAISDSLDLIGGTISANTATATGTSASGALVASVGGAYLGGAQTTTSTNVTYSGNHATTVGGGQAAIAQAAGLIHNLGIFELDGGTISENVASATGASGDALAAGGGMAFGPGASSMKNVTVSGNEAEASGGASATELGGGMYVQGTPLNVTSATFAFNEAATGASLAVRDLSGVVRVRNSIVSDPLGGANCAELDGGDVVSDGFNLSSDASCDFTAGGDQQNTDPDLGPLADNGGPTFTHALPLSSPAVDQGSAAASGDHPALTTDQRGSARPADQASVANAAGGDGSDIGAFELEPVPVYQLTVTKAGNGAGYVDSSPAGIDCGTGTHTDCAEGYTDQTPVTLTAHPSAGSTFTGFSGGGCTGTAPCLVTMDQARSVTATFTLNQYTLTVATTGSTGQGYVDSSPAGIDCGTFGTHNDCTNLYDHGQLVTLTAHPSTGSTFTGFSGGGCTGTAPCVVTMDQARSVTATFTLNQYTLTVATTGSTGQGYVDSSPAGIDCGTFGTHNDCTNLYDHGQLVTLTAHPSTGSTFTGFSGGGCTGTAPCVVTMDQARSVTATFALQFSAAVLADNPVGYWRFGETSGTTAFDSSASVPKNNGTYLNGPLLGQTGALGDGNTAASFDGVNDTVRVPDANSLDVGDSFTLEGWVKRSSSTSSQTLFNKGTNGFQLMLMNAPNGNQLWLRKAGITTIAKSTGGIPGDGQFHHFVVTKNGPSTVFYIDNVPGTTILAPAQVIANTSDLLTFADPGSTPHVFDEWALYDSVLTAADVSEHYAART